MSQKFNNDLEIDESVHQNLPSPLFVKEGNSLLLEGGIRRDLMVHVR